MRESKAIERVRRFATSDGALGLFDDVALLDGLVLTHDSLAEGVHFLSSDPPASVGWKLVAVNLSDLAGKGARPAGALLSLALSDDEEWDLAFLDGVEAACESYGLPLLGGDTIALPPAAPRVFGLTAIGRAGVRVPLRSGAKAGDALWVAGTIGDAGVGLDQLVDDAAATGPLVDTYRRPVPQLAVGQALAPHAHAMMDVSDGLLLDASRLAQASGVSARIDLAALPLSRAFIAERGNGLDSRRFAATAGDDYALLAAFPPELDPLSLSLPSRTTIARIGTLSADGPTLSLVHGGDPVPLPERLGFEHLGNEHRGHPPSPVADRH